MAKEIPEYDPDTGYPISSRKAMQKALDEERKQRETKPVTELAIRTALRTTETRGQKEQPEAWIVINGVSHTFDEWTQIRRDLLKSDKGLW